MKSRTLAVAALALGAVAVIAYLALVRLPPTSVIIFHNGSASELSNVVVSGADFRESFPRVKPGQTIVLRSHPHADTGIAVAFEAAGRSVSVPEQDYAGGGGYKIHVEVGPDLSVSVRSALAV